MTDQRPGDGRGARRAQLRRYGAVAITSTSIAWLSVALYGSSLALTSFVTETADIRGFEVLSFGWAGVALGASLSWLANLTFVLTFAFWRRSPGASLASSAIGFVLALTSFAVGTLGFDPAPRRITGHGVGYYLWLASHLVLLSAVLVRTKASLERGRDR